jgi:hypothetical protein
MVNTSNDKFVPELYASSEEVEALKIKLDTFMHEQTTHNKAIITSLEKLLKLAEESGAKLPNPLPEDKGSSVRGKDTSRNYKIPQLRRIEYSRGDPHAGRKVNFASHSSTMPHKPMTPQHNQYQPPSQDAQYEEDDFSEYDDGEEYFEQPWNYSKPDELCPKQPFSIPPPNPHPNQPPISLPHQTQNPYSYQNPNNTLTHNHTYQPYNSHTYQANKEKQPNHSHNYNYNPNPNPQYHYYHPPSNHNYNQHFQYQQRTVARGPKLNFPEFCGEDTDGWLRKAEKYFELIGVPNEERVKIVVMYINGKAEFWWRRT